MGDQLMTIRLNGSDLTVTQVMAVARHGEAVALAPEAVGAMRRARAVVENVLAGGEPVYGLTTGVGERKAYLLDPAERRQFGAGAGRAYRMIRELVPFTQADGTFPADLEPVVDLVTRGDLTPAA
jgi:histidine ammonia-lyase